MAYHGLIHRFPLVFAYVLFCALHSLTLALLRPYRYAYLIAYSVSVPFGLLMESAAIVSVFWALSADCPNFRRPGAILLNGLGLAGVGAAWLTAFVSQPIPDAVHAAWTYDAVQLLIRYASAAQAVILIGALALIPRSQRIPLPKLPRRIALVLIVDTAISLICAWVSRNYGFTHVFTSQVISTGSGLVLGILWLLTLKKDGQESGIPPSPLEDLDQDARNLAILPQFVTRRFRNAAGGADGG